MFFDAERIVAVREMILAEDEAGRRTALSRIAPMQRDDFLTLFQVMDGQPVTIRLLDPPLHEFLPSSADEIDQIAAAAGISAETVKRRAAALVELNPMLGHRGCRLGITYPEIYEMQALAIFEAAIAADAPGNFCVAGDHDSAGRNSRRTRQDESSGRCHCKRGHRENRNTDRLSGRHYDRIAPCGLARR